MVEEADGALAVLASGWASEDKFNDSRNFSASDKLSFLLLVSFLSVDAMVTRNACVVLACVEYVCRCKREEGKQSLSAYTCQDLKLKQTMGSRAFPTWT